MVIGKIQRCCIVCGARLPDMSQDALLEKGCGIRKGDGSVLWHCPGDYHKPAEILIALHKISTFSTGNEYRR